MEITVKINPKLKWPNDLTLNGKKLAGILLDSSIESNKIENVILGVGINFKIKPRILEKTIKKTQNFYGVTTLVEKNEQPLALVQQFLYELENVLVLINSGSTKRLLREWTKRSSTIGKSISVKTDDGNITGKALKLDSDGGLIISNRQKTRKLLVGDIVHKNY